MQDTADNAFKKTSSLRLTTIFLVLMNLVPIYGVLAWGWAVFDIMVLYWIENIIIGVINILKILTWGKMYRGVGPFSFVLACFLACFFLVHYGGFTMGHGLFIFAFLADETLKEAAGQGPLHGLYHFIVNNNGGLFLAAAGIFAGHILSYIRHFIVEGGYKETHPMLLMKEPYARVFLLHVSIIFGGAVVAMTGGKIWLLVVLVALKSVADAGIHVKKHSASKDRNTMRLAIQHVMQMKNKAQ